MRTYTVCLDNVPGTRRCRGTGTTTYFTCNGGRMISWLLALWGPVGCTGRFRGLVGVNRAMQDIFNGNRHRGQWTR